MRRVWLALVAGLLALTVVSAAPAVAKPPVRGDIDLMAVAPGSCGPVTWSGTVTFPDGVHGLYLAAADVAPVDRGVTMHYQESFTVVGEPLMPGSCPDGSETMLLTGWDAGIGVFVNDTFRANGVVTDTGTGYDMWDGHKVHMGGDIVVVESVPTLDGVIRLSTQQAVRWDLDADVYASPNVAGVTGDGYEGDVLSLNVEVGNIGLIDAEDVRLTIDVEGSADPTGPLPSGCFIDGGGGIRCDIGLVSAEDLTVIGPAPFTLTGPGLAEFTATVTTTTREIELENNTDRVSYTVPEPEPLEVEIVDVQYAPDLPGGPYPGDTVSATVRVRNTGPPAADDVGASITYSRATPLGPLPPGCAADEPTNTIACDLGDLDGLNPTSLPLTFVAGTPGSLELTATASAPAKGPPATDTVTVTISARPEVDIRVTDAYNDLAGAGTGRVLARVVEVTGSGGSESNLPVGTSVVVSTWTTGTRPITLFGGTSCAGSPDDPSPCSPRTLLINSYTFESLEIESGVAVPYALVDGGGYADVYVRVDPAPPAVDPNPSNDDNRQDTCVAGCIGLAAPPAPGEADLYGLHPS